MTENVRMNGLKVMIMTKSQNNDTKKSKLVSNSKLWHQKVLNKKW